MSVYTSVAPEELKLWLKNYSLGELKELQGIASGIENTNYFVYTTHGKFVLTLFEKLRREELPYFLNLMAHLAKHGIPCPIPIANLENEYLGELKTRPASIVSCLTGSSITEPQAAHCAQVGDMLATMHQAGKSYPAHAHNSRGPSWWRATAPVVKPKLKTDEAELLDQELRFQAAHRFTELPRGVIHADLFRDNVLFNGETLSGVIDFYYACDDVWLYDLAIAVNDWCIDASGVPDGERMRAMLEAYHAARPLSRMERKAWPVMLRAASLRFWLSRLYDLHFPRPGELTHAKDPRYFQRLLQHYALRQDALDDLWVA